MNYWLIAYYGDGHLYNEVHKGSLVGWFCQDNHVIEGEVYDLIVGAWPIAEDEYNPSELPKMSNDKGWQRRISRNVIT